jgi:hypothetical protein
MRRILVCTGVLGGGTALVFALAAATAMLFPQGTVVSAGFNGNVMFGQTAPAFGGPVMVKGVNSVVPVLEAPDVAVPDPAP